MPTTQYTHPDWAAPKQNHEAGSVSGVGSFPRNWLDAQDDTTLTTWGITREVVPDPVPTPEEVAAVFAAQVKGECSARIFAVLKDMTTTVNMNAYATELVAKVSKDGATLTAQETTDLALARAARSWVEDMQTACRTLIIAGEAGFADDQHWTPVPDGLADFANRF